MGVGGGGGGGGGVGGLVGENAVDGCFIPVFNRLAEVIDQNWNDVKACCIISFAASSHVLCLVNKTGSFVPLCR